MGCLELGKGVQGDSNQFDRIVSDGFAKLGCFGQEAIPGVLGGGGFLLEQGPEEEPGYQGRDLLQVLHLSLRKGERLATIAHEDPAEGAGVRVLGGHGDGHRYEALEGLRFGVDTEYRAVHIEGGYVDRAGVLRHPPDQSVTDLDATVPNQAG